MARQGMRPDGGKERFWRRLLRLWRRSELTARAFCDQHGVSEPSFYAWRRTIAQRDEQRRQRQTNTPAADDSCATSQPVFVPLRVVPTAAGMAFEVVLGQGRVVRVPAGFDAASLRQLLAILEEPSC
jgi:hypothetical protein